MLHGGALGDCLLAYQLMRRVICHPERNLKIIARHSAHRWLTQRGLIAASAFADDCGVSALYSDRPRLPEKLNEWIANCTLVVNMIDPPGAVVERNLAGASAVPVVLIDPRPDGSSRHIVEQWEKPLKCRASKRGIDLNPKAFSGDEPVQTLALDSLRGSRIASRDSHSPTAVTVIVHPGSGGIQKCAPLDWFESIAARAAGLELQAAWMIGPDECERDGLPLRQRLEQTAPVIMEPNICAAADRLAGADIFVGNDCGMAHLAALCGLRTIVWYGPTDPVIWRPIGPDVHVVRDTDQAAFVHRVMQLVEALNRESR